MNSRGILELALEDSSPAIQCISYCRLESVADVDALQRKC